LQYADIDEALRYAASLAEDEIIELGRREGRRRRRHPAVRAPGHQRRPQ